jgi:putative peptide zinc metalloprotease protein
LSGQIAPGAPLLSPQWFRVAPLRPRLDPMAHAERVSYRRAIWHVLVRPDGSRSFRLNSAAYAVVARCDGTLSLQRLWDLLLGELKDDAPTQDELLQLLARLHSARLLSFDRKPDFGPQGTVSDQSAAETLPGSANSLLSFRIPLGRPDGWLRRIAPYLRGLFTPAALALWGLIVLAGVVLTLLNIGTLLAHAHAWLNTPRLLLMVWMAYPVVKALHELAHALMLVHLGGKVPVWGVTIMMFTPVPYVDASAASALASPVQRLLVSAAGIMLELLLAALALVVALTAQDGDLRDLAFAVFFIGTVSTLIVNGNPLLRFDGYFVLTDALQLPNLATRSARHWLSWMRQRVLGTPGEPVLPAAGERLWLWAFAPAALAYRVLISVGIVFWLGELSFFLGVAIAAYFVWGLALKPLLALGHFLQGPALAETERRVARRRAGVAGAGVLALVGVLPLPFASVVQGVVWLPEQARVRAETDGFIRSIHVHDGQSVRAGQLLFTLSAPLLEPQRARLEGRITALDTERYKAMQKDPSGAVGFEYELDSARGELARIQERLAHLEVLAKVDGVAVINHADDLIGHFVKQGTLLAHLLTPEPNLVRVAIPQEQASLVQGSARTVSVRLAQSLGQAFSGELLHDVAGTVAKLPSAALGDRSGGAIVTDPDDKLGLTPAHGVVLADVQLSSTPAELADVRIGARAWVRIDHGLAPLALQAARRLQQQFLKHFNPSQ